MLGHLITQTEQLKETDLRASFHIAKELAIIEIQIKWHPEKLDAHINRLWSLGEHVMITFKKSQTARTLALDIRNTAMSLKSNNKI